MFLAALLPAAAQTVEHKTRFDPEMLPGVRGLAVAFPLSNSRQIARAPGGAWLLAFDVPDKGLFLAQGPPGCAEGGRFDQFLLIVGDGAAGILGTASKPAGISINVAGDSLTLAWSDAKGVWLARATLPGRLAPASLEPALRAASRPALIVPGAALGDLAADGQGRIALAYATRDGVFVARESARGWTPEKVSDAGSEPVLDIDSRQRLHLAFRSQRETPFFGDGRKALDPRIAYAMRDSDGWRTPEIAAHGLSFHPAIAAAGDEPVIAFQHEGMKRVAKAGEKYLEDREGGGSSIGYAAGKASGWNTGFVSQAQEMLVRDGSVADGSVGRLYPMVEQKWRPRMAVDKHGVVWTLWPDTTRRHTYFARWLGSAFSDPYEVRGGYYAPSEYISVEKHMPADAAEIGFAYAAAGRLYFGTIPLPGASTADSRHLLFLDLLEIAEAQGVRQNLNRFAKHPENPVFRPAEPGSWDDYGVTFPNVRFDGSKFTMEYFGHGAGGTAGAWSQGYAESADGIRWSRPNLGLIEHNGSRANNLIPWVPNFYDHREPDPAKKYKGVLVEGHWITNFKRPIAYSADGIHWRYGQDTVDLTSMLEGGGPAFRDELDTPERRYKSVGRTISQNHRSLGMMWSPDLIHWYGEEAILDVEDPYGKPAMQWRGRYVAGRILDPSGDQAGDQIYWGTVWIEHGLYLCLYAPYRYDGGYQAALAMSRDGYNYVRVRNGEFILPRGTAGTWDSGFVAVGYGFNVPFRVGDKMRVYYGGVPSHHGTDPWRASAAIGMAELPVDGWTFLSPELNTAESYVTTIPILVAPGARRLYVKAGMRPGAGSLEAELLDAETGRPLPGYSRAQCRALRDANGESVFAWAGADAIPTSSRKIRVRFYLSGAETRLYSFWFE
ncbi:MAG: hypothetical protein KIT09_07505 [Bryobacteraceae bacterium]|nr:hypothetical protein [Bryobacteraceae bacterium]